MPPSARRPVRDCRPHRAGGRPLRVGQAGQRWTGVVGGVLIGLAIALALLLGTPARAQPSTNPLDSQLTDGLQAVAPLVAPKPPLSTVVPSQVLRWRQEAQALEHGENGMPRDPARAATLYCQAAQHGDAEAQFSLAWMLTNGRGIERDDAQAAHLFLAAAEQGMPQAQRIMEKLGTPLGEPPPCLRPMAVQLPTPPAPPVTVAQQTRRAAPTIALPEPPLPPNAPAPIVNFVRLVAPEFKLSPQLVLAIIATESGFNPNAVSPANAQGLMQLIPATAERFKVRNPFDPAQNIRGGMAYLRWLMAYYQGNVVLVAAAYNAGEGAVNRYRGVPPYLETLGYVRKVLAHLNQVTFPYDPSVTEPSPLLPLMRVAGLQPATRR
jgi:soluble lytic murein transglycosylase-like protein